MKEGTSINMLTTVEEDIEEPVEESLYCCNCKRRHSTTSEFESTFHNINFVIKFRHEIKEVRSFRCIRDKMRGQGNESFLNMGIYTLCNECAHFLTSGNDKDRKNFSYVWPALCWSLLEDRRVRGSFDSKQI